jgi:hypothetical protein
VNTLELNAAPINAIIEDVSSTPAPVQLIIDDRGNLLWFAALPNFYIRL